MTILGIALFVAEVVTLGAFVQLYRKHLIVRHLFIHYSDWCANKIDEMTESASLTITELLKEDAKQRGSTLADEDARGAIPYDILNAKGEWQDQADYLQAMLRRNGMSPLNAFDADTLIRNPGLAGLKGVPMPQPRRA